MKTMSMGKTTFCCRDCQAVTVVENLDLEVMTGFKCGNCGLPMNEARFAKLKFQYYARLYQALTTPPFGGEGVEMFKVQMEFNPHFEQEDKRNHEESDD